MIRTQNIKDASLIHYHPEHRPNCQVSPAKRNRLTELMDLDRKQVHWLTATSNEDMFVKNATLDQVKLIELKLSQGAKPDLSVFDKYWPEAKPDTFGPPEMIIKLRETKLH